MKKKGFFTLMCIMMIASFAHAQTVLTYDFYKGEFLEPLKPIRTGEFVVLKFVNVNTFRYKVELEGKSINYVTAVPSELQVLFRLPNTSTPENTNDGLAKLDDGSKLISNELIKQEVKAKTQGPALLKKTNTYKDWLEKLQEEMAKYVVVAQKTAEIKFRRAQLIDLSRQDWESFSKMQEKLPARLTESAMKSDYNKFISYYATIETIYKSAYVAAIDVGQEAMDEVEKIKTKLDEGNKQIKEDDYLNLIRDILVLQDGLENKKYFIVTSPPVQIDGDYVALTAKAEPIQANDLSANISSKSIKFELPAKGGWKADFSVGPAFSFGRNAIDDNYYIQKVTDTTGSLIRSTNRSVLFPAVAAMIHAYPRTGKSYNVGFMMGVGAGFKTTSDVNASYYLGGSLVLGKREKIMVNAGVSYLPVNRIKSNYHADGTLYDINLNLGEVSEKVIKRSVFFSISYNITNRVEVK